MATLSAFARSSRRRILFIGGSLNQTTMLHKIAVELGDHEAYFTPFYAEASCGARPSSACSISPPWGAGLER